MKHLVTIAFISACLFSFAQTSMSNMYWNNFSNFNPAMSGFQYDQHASATYIDYYPALSSSSKSLLANAGTNFGNHHGVGIVYTGDYYFGVNSHTALVNYNYQINLKKAGKIALGTGLGVGHASINNDKFIFGDSAAALIPPKTNFELNLGVSYNWKNLFVGFSATNLTPTEEVPLSSYYYGPGTGYHLFVQNDFRIAKKFDITPRIIYMYQDGYQQLQFNTTVSYNEKYSVGFSMSSRDNIGVNLGWDILNKFRVAYMYAVTVSKLNNGVSGGVHEFTLGYLLKR